MYSPFTAFTCTHLSPPLPADGAMQVVQAAGAPLEGAAAAR